MSVVDLQSCKEKLEEAIKQEFNEVNIASGFGNTRIGLVDVEIKKLEKRVLERVVALEKACVIVPRKKLEEFLNADESNWETGNAIVPRDLKERCEKESLMAYTHGRRKLLRLLLGKVEKTK